MTIKILGSDRGSAEGRRRCVTLGRALIVLLLSPCLAIYGNAQTQFQVLHAFGSGIDGEALWSAVIFDTQGSIYGTANAGGAYGTGTVYELVRSENGEWTENVLHSFDGYPMDGMFPWGEVLTGDGGMLYGTTANGGEFGYGVVYDLVPDTVGFTENVIYSFDRPGVPGPGATSYKTSWATSSVRGCSS
jgi:uncharacterized repeat protein (TIGR03803 family)